MQCAKLMGANKIIALDIDETRLQIAKDNNLADITINPQKENYMNIINSQTNNRGADGVIECGGTDETFKIAWQIARPNAIVAIVAMYENPQILPLPNMYGKNLTFKTGGVDAIHCKKLIELISQNKLNTDFLISKEITLSEIIQGYEIFKNKPDGLLKIAVIPD